MNVAVAAVSIAMIIASCGVSGGGHCSKPPAGSVNAFFPGREPSRDVVATVSSITPLTELGGFRYDMSDGARLTWISASPIAGVTEGARYRFVVDYAGGFPDASGIVVYEGDRLLFAGHTDQKPFEHVLKNGIPGFTIAFGEPACSSRDSSRCHESIVNLPLVVVHGEERRSLHQGETARVGDFEVRLLTSQRVTYSSSCADAGLPGVSFTIARVK